MHPCLLRSWQREALRKSAVDQDLEVVAAAEGTLFPCCICAVMWKEWCTNLFVFAVVAAAVVEAEMQQPKHQRKKKRKKKRKWILVVVWTCSEVRKEVVEVETTKHEISSMKETHLCITLVRLTPNERGTTACVAIFAGDCFERQIVVATYFSS